MNPTKRRLYPESQKVVTTKNKSLLEGLDEGNSMIMSSA
jgi:hypothetical protein